MKKAVRYLLCTVILLCLSLTLLPSAAYAINNGGTYYFYEGDMVNFTYSVLQTEEVVEYLEIPDGELPDGVSCTSFYNEGEMQTYLRFTGTLKETGTIETRLKVHGSYGGYEEYLFTFVVTEVEKPAPVLKVIKSPTSETVAEGGKATFISAAENYGEIEWRIVTPDGSACWRNEVEIENKFTGVSYNAFLNDDGREYLVLSNIPLSMDGYYVQTKFWSESGTEKAFTQDHSAKLTVLEALLNAPKFTKQPSGAEMTMGSNHTLECSATAADGNVCYQWYKNSSAGTSGGKKIEGATQSKFIPEQTEGECFYYCAVWAAKNGKVSDTAYSEAVSVRYSLPATLTPEPTPEPTPKLTPEPETPQPTAAVNNGEETEKGQKSSGMTIILVAAAVAAVALVSLAIIARRNAKLKSAREAAAKNAWQCTKCGALNRGRFCQNCGAPKPRGELQYACDKCGWMPEDPAHPPRFCPDCGDPFGDEDVIN